MADAVLIDGHVHLHACHEVEAVLDAALDNLAGVDAARTGEREVAGCLWLVEAAGEQAAERLRRASGERWRRTERDLVTWELRRRDGRGLLVVLGRQIRTAEDLEVLVVGTAEEPEEDLPLEATIRAWLDRDVLVMIPWGFGKWSARRRRVVERAWEAAGPDGPYLADTGLRPRWLPEPALFARSRAVGRPVFLGSDPSPFRSRLEAIASTGFVVPDPPADAGWPAMREGIARLAAPLRRFGQPLGTIDFVALQARLQLRKRLGRR